MAPSRRRGIVLAWVVIFVVVMLCMIGMACDLAYLYFTGQKLQVAADAAALAGAQKVKVDTIAAARQLAAAAGLANTAAGAGCLLDLNSANAAGGDIVIGHFDRNAGVFTPTLTGADAVRVVTRRPDGGSSALSLLFGPIFSIFEVKLSRTAIAMTVGSTGAGILVLDPHAPGAFVMNGNSIVNMPNGCIQIDSDHAKAIATVGNPVVNAPDVNVVSSTGTFGSNTTVTGNLNLGTSLVPDPLAHLQDNPPPLGQAMTIPKGLNVVLAPGYYPAGVKWTVGTLTLQPGMYAFGGMGFQVTGGTVTGEGVMIYVRPGGTKTRIDLRGGGAVSLSPMTSGPYAGVTIYQDIGETADAVINGTDQIHVQGALYFPGATAYLAGTGDGFGNQLIAKQVQIAGNSSININYDGRNAGPAKVFLVK